jgi:hypothetical protein
MQRPTWFSSSPARRSHPRDPARREPVVQGACEVHCGEPRTAQVTRRQVPVVGHLPQPPGLLEVVSMYPR